MGRKPKKWARTSECRPIVNPCVSGIAQGTAIIPDSDSNSEDDPQPPLQIAAHPDVPDEAAIDDQMELDPYHDEPDIFGVGGVEFENDPGISTAATSGDFNEAWDSGIEPSVPQLNEQPPAQQMLVQKRTCPKPRNRPNSSSSPSASYTPRRRWPTSEA